MLAIVLAAAAVDPGTLVPAGARMALVARQAIPSAEEAAALLGPAGERAPILRPASLGGGYQRALGLNPFDGAMLREAGVAPQAPLVLGSLKDVDFLTFGIASADATRARLEAFLATAGPEVADVRRKAGPVRVARRGQQVLAAYRIRADRAWVARATTAGADPVAALDSMLAGPKLASSPGWKAMPRLVTPFRLVLESLGRGGGPVIADITRSGGKLVASGRAGVPSPPLLARTSSPSPVLAAPGSLAVFRMRLADGATAAGGPLAQAIAWVTRQICSSCSREVAERTGEELARHAESPAHLIVDNLRPRELGQPGAFPLLWAVKLKDPDAATRALASVASRLDAAAGEGTSWSRPMSGGGRIFFGIATGHLWVATDPGARDRGLQALAAGTASPSPAPLAGRVDTAAVGRALSSINALDAFKGGALAGIFAARLELGSLLTRSGPIALTASPAGPSTYTFDLEWNLLAP